MMGPRDERLEALAEQLGVELEFVRECVLHGVLIVESPADEPRSLASDQLARLRRVRRLCDALELDVFAGALVVELLEQRDALRRDLDRLRGAGPA